MAELSAEAEVPPELLRALGAIPSYYLRYYYRTREMLERQTQGPTRAEEVAQIEHDLLELYGDPDLAEKPQLLERRGGAFYSEAAAQLVASLASGTGDVQVVNARNAGAIPNLADDDVVEVAARVDTDGVHPIPVAPLGQDMLGLVQQAKAYERLTIEAATTGNRSTALRALLANPLVPDVDAATGLLDAILDANREHLPRFTR
jgi:6-phospho-beta-glucosidase